MRLRGLIVENFMSYSGIHKWYPEDGLTIIEGVNLDTVQTSSNGAGKSSLLYAICWALYGKVPPGGIKNSVINHNHDSCQVQLDLIGEYHLRIHREKSEGGSEKLRFWVGAEEFNLGDPAKTQKRLEYYYGIDWECFCNTVYLGESSGTMRFVRATPTQRAALLEHFVDDEVFQQAAERVVAEVKVLGERDSELRGVIQTLGMSIDTCMKDIERLNGSITLEELALDQRNKVLSQQSSAKETELLRLSNFIKTTPPRTQQEVQADMNATQNAYQLTFTKAVTLRTLSGLALQTVGQDCPQCGQVVSAAAVQKQQQARQQAWDELQKVEKQQFEFQKRLKDLQEEFQAGLDHARQVEQAKVRIEAVHAEMALIRQQASDSHMLGYLQREREMAAKRMNTWRQEQESYIAEVSKIHQRLPHLKTLANGFKKEIRNLLLDDLRQVLTYYAEEYRYILAGNEISIEFPQTNKENFEIVIKTGDVANPLTSGGETDRASFSVVLALRKALLYNKRCPFTFLLVDDPIGKLDEPGAVDFFQLLDHLTADYTNVIVTVPRTLQVSVPHHKLTVSRKGRTSIIKFGGERNYEPSPIAW